MNFLGLQFAQLLENGAFEHDVIPDSPEVEPVSADLQGKAAVRIRHLQKTFHPRGKDPVTAVDGKEA